MKPLQEYRWADWRRLRPLSHAAKTAHYRYVDAQYRRRDARAGGLQDLTQAIQGRKVAVTVAYNDPETILWQSQLVRRYLSDVVYVVADNSGDPAAAKAIAEVALREGRPYVWLPANPWTSRKSASRSHGVALNWIWANLLRPGRPYAFGFLDDDLYPTAPDDPFAPLDAQTFFGMVRESGARWFLWAGFCFYRFESVQSINLDFSQDWFNGLDTGGGNWRTLYRHVQRSAQREAQSWLVPSRDDVALADAPLQWVGTWLHEVGFMGRPEFAESKREAVRAMLAPHLLAL